VGGRGPLDRRVEEPAAHHIHGHSDPYRREPPGHGGVLRESGRGGGPGELSASMISGCRWPHRQRPRVTRRTGGKQSLYDVYLALMESVGVRGENASVTAPNLELSVTQLPAFVLGLLSTCRLARVRQRIGRELNPPPQPRVYPPLRDHDREPSAPPPGEREVGTQ
jgi:hypothetical protein